jgi:hypothetical protein
MYIPKQEDFDQKLLNSKFKFRNQKVKGHEPLCTDMEVFKHKTGIFPVMKTLE